MSQRLNPFYAALAAIRNRMVRTRPCAHENADTSLGNGQVWAKCEDCGQTFQQANWDAAKARAKEHDAAIEQLDDIHDATREVFVLVTRRQDGKRPDFVKTVGHSFTPGIGTKLLFESAQCAEDYLEQIILPQIPQARDYYEVRPIYVVLL